MNPHQTIPRRDVEAFKRNLDYMLLARGYRAYSNGHELTVYARTRVPEREEDVFVDDGGTRIGRDRVLKVAVRKADAENAILNAQVDALLRQYGAAVPHSYAGNPGTRVYEIRRERARLLSRLFGRT